MTTIFVYGTLKKGEGNHNHFLADANYLGKAITRNSDYTMYTNGGYPGVVFGGKTRIHGEMYSVDEDQLNSIRSLEGYRINDPKNGLYDEIEIEVMNEKGKNIKAFTYIYNSTMPEKIESGIWN